jgi:serpin B
MNRIAILLLSVFVSALPAKAAEPLETGAPAKLAELVQGNNAFAVNLYARLRRGDGNVFFSPYSISTALAMTYAGARAETAEQMAKVLHFALEPKELHPAFTELTRALNGYGLPPEYRLYVANSLWGDRSVTWREDCRTCNLIKANYGTRVRPADFRSEFEQARRQINRRPGAGT